MAYDWRKAAPPDILDMRPYDLVLSADAIYRADLLEPFLRALDAVVGAELLIAHKRQAGNWTTGSRRRLISASTSPRPSATRCTRLRR